MAIKMDGHTITKLNLIDVDGNLTEKTLTETLNLQTKNVTPTTSAQNIEPSDGYDALSKVTVNPIPYEYVIPSGDTDVITTNGRHDVAGKATAVVDVQGEGTETGVYNMPGVTQLYNTFNSATNLAEAITINAPDCTYFYSTFAKITANVREITINAGDSPVTTLRASVIGSTSNSGINTVTQILHLNCTFSNCNYQQAFQNAQALETLDADLDFTGTSSSGVGSIFANCTQLQNLRFVQNSLSVSLDIRNCHRLSDASLVSVANSLNSSAAGNTLSLSTTAPTSGTAPRARIKTIKGTVDEDGVFALDEDGTVTLEEFITGTDHKGWTLNELNA